MPLTVCGLDLGGRHHGVAILGAQVHYTAMWNIGPPPASCSALGQALAQLFGRYPVDLIAIEDYHGRGLHTRVEREILLHTGAVLGLAKPGLAVTLVPVQAWQDAIVGQRPVPKRDGGTPRLWKATVRDHVSLGLAARRLRWVDEAPDPGGHRYDALGVALYAQDWQRKEGP